MSVKKFVVNDNPPTKISEGLHPEDIHLSRIGKSLTVRSVEKSETVYFHRPDGIQGSGEVLSVGPHGEIVAMANPILPFEKSQEVYLTPGSYYRSRGSCLTKSKEPHPEANEGIKRENVEDASEIRRHMAGIDHEVSEMENRPEDENLDRGTTGAPQSIQSASTGQTSGYSWPKPKDENQDGEAYKKWQENFDKSKQNEGEESPAMAAWKAKSEAQKTPEGSSGTDLNEEAKDGKTEELAGEHIGRHKKKFGMDQKQAVAVWLNESREKGLGGVKPKPKEEADLNAADKTKIVMEDPVEPLESPKTSKAMDVWESKVAERADLQKAFRSKAGEERWAAAVRRGKKRSEEGHPHTMNKAHVPHIPANKQIIVGDLDQGAGGGTATRTGPKKGTPAYEKFITTLRTNNPKINSQQRPASAVAPSRLQNRPAQKLEEVLQQKKNAPPGSASGKKNIRQYRGMGGTKGIAGATNASVGYKINIPKKESVAMAKSAREKTVKTKPATKEQVLPSQAPSMKQLADKKLPPSEMPPRSR